MNIKEAKQEIKNTVKAYLLKENGEYKISSIRQRPILLMGPPGVGKTQIMEQIARECGIGLVSYTITHHTRQSAVGLPFIEKQQFEGKQYSVTEYTMSEIIASIYKKMKDTGLREGILFIDEINCVSETLAPTMLQFLQCKTFGNQKVPEGWIIVAAGNPPEYNKSVRDFDVVTLDRVRRIDITSDYEAWKEYAREQKIHSAILSYLELHPANFYRMETDVDGMRFVTARGWEDFSNLLYSYESLQIPVNEEIIYEFLRQEDVAEDVAAYLELYQSYKDDYGIEEILQGKVSTEIYRRLFQADFDERATVVRLLGEGLNTLFDSFFQQKLKTDAWYQFLKQYRGQVEEATDVALSYQELIAQRKQEFYQKEKAELLSKRERKQQESWLKEWGEYVPKRGQSPKEAFLQAKTGFEQQIGRLEEIKKQTGVALEYAFDFMEEAFQKGEEMILFVTDLTLSSASTVFLAEYPCERYLQYSEELLIGSRKQKLLSELKEK